MELLYTYIKGIGSCFENDEFTFSNEYFITYDKNTKKITINKNKNYKYKDFFSSKIRSINLVVGKNGAGKTTLLELLGSQKSERRQKFKFDREEDGWFAIYKRSDPNDFYIEGENIELLPNCFERCKKQADKRLYSLIFSYDFENNSIKEDNFYRRYDNVENTNICYFNGKNYETFSQDNRVYTDEIETWLLPRKIIADGNVKSLYLLAIKEKDFFQKVVSRVSKLNIQLFDLVEESNDPLSIKINESFTQDEIDKLNKCDELYFMTMKHTMFAIYESLSYGNSSEKNEVVDLIDEKLKSTDLNCNALDKIRKMLQVICKYCDEKEKDYVIKNPFMIYDDFLFKVYEKIKKLPTEFVVRKEKKNLRTNKESKEIFNRNVIIKIDLKGEYNKEVEEFLDLFENGINREFIFLYDFRRMFNVNFDNNVSEGELQFINVYSGIYNAISNLEYNQQSIIILMDEPDKNFHPMWISSFIKNLVSLVDFTSKDKDIKYQFIITTHSPFMLSDMPKEYVTCIDINDKTEKRIVKKATKSFVSNYYQIIQDSFFLEDSVGQFAKEKINHVIKRINNIDQNDIKECDIQNIQNTISIIDDPHLKTLLTNLLNKKISKYNKKESLRIEKEMLESRLKDIENEMGELK